MKQLLPIILALTMLMTFGPTALAVPPSTTLTATLITDGGSDGENIDVGDLEGSFDGTNLNIEFTTDDGWETDETHPYVGAGVIPKSFPDQETNFFSMPLM